MTISPHADGQIAAIRTDYEALLPWGEALNPERNRKDAVGRIRQRYPANLLRRLRRYQDDVRGPFRSPTCPSPISSPNRRCACPRSRKRSPAVSPLRGTAAFCTVRPYLDTLRTSRGVDLLQALVCLFRGTFNGNVVNILLLNSYHVLHQTGACCCYFAL